MVQWTASSSPIQAASTKAVSTQSQLARAAGRFLRGRCGPLSLSPTRQRLRSGRPPQHRVERHSGQHSFKRLVRGPIHTVAGSRRGEGDLPFPAGGCPPTSLFHIRSLVPPATPKQWLEVAPGGTLG